MAVTEHTATAWLGAVKSSGIRALTTSARTFALLAYLALILAAAMALVGPVLSGGAGAGAADHSAAEPGAPDAGATLPLDSGKTRSFVTRSGRSLNLDGKVFRFTGFNLYNAAASDIYSCPSAVRLNRADLDAAMRQVRDAGGTVVRFWAFQSYTRGGTDYAAVDRVLASAHAHGLKVLPVIENQWSDCSRAQRAPLSEVRDGTWFTAGYRARLPGQALPFRDYARRITHRYRDNPTVFAWSLINEAETTGTDIDGQSDLVAFASDMSEVVDASDPHHLLTLGTQSNGAPGASGADFSEVYGLPGLDFAEVHDWANRGSDDQAMPGASTGSLLPAPSQCHATTASLACSFALALALDKPIIVAEAGIAADSRPDRVTRARQLAAKLDAAFQAGASGYLIWQLNRTNTDGYGVAIGSGDPIYPVLQEARRRWAPD